MFRKRTASLLVSFAVLMIGVAPSVVAIDIPLKNWAAPPVYHPLGSSGTKSLMTDAAPLGLPFVPVTPCRLADTRGLGFTGQAGPPSLAANSARSFVVTGTVPGVTTQCGVPTSAWAISLNLAVVNMTTNGNLIVYGGGTAPVTSAVNWNATSVVVSGSTVVGFPGNSISVLFNGPAGAHVDAIIDVNGYYSPAPNSSASSLQWLNTAPGGGAIFGVNSSTTDFSVGVVGVANGTTGRTYGVFGSDGSSGAPGSNDSAGVLGRDSAGGPIASVTNLIGSAGVRGEGKNGVVGITTSAIAEIGGVVGNFLTGSTLNTIGGLATSSTVAVYGLGNLSISGTKSFIDPHPTDASKVIDYVSLEGPEAGTYFRGTGQIVHGMAIIDVPEHFAMVTDPEGLTVQLTPIGASSNMYIESEGLDGIVVRASRDVKFHYLVQGVRSAFRDHQPIAENTMFVPRSSDAQMPTALSVQQKKRLVENGTYNADGTPNKDTARALGWAKVWEEKAKPASNSN
jgi:hypothetical protein